MKKFGHYEVTAELGRGGMGVVYKGWDPSLNRKVAIKALGEHLLNDKDLVERFTREAKATAALNDINVIQIYYIGEEKGQPYFAMEYIEGKSLDDILKGGKSLSIQHAKNILSQACSGLSAAHKLGLVHRDIKPANIMITNDGTLKIVDFGIARTREYGDKLTNTGEFVGTPGYLSPEVCIGQEVDLRSDIFSLGIAFYEMLSGKVPFENDSPLGLMLEVVQADIPDVRELNKKVDKKTSYVLKKMIAKSPDERYQSCDEIIRDLGQTIDNQDLYLISNEAVTVDIKTKKVNLSDQLTIPSAAAITQNNMIMQSVKQTKSKKSWLIAAGLFVTLGAVGFGLYSGYLPMPGTSQEPATAFVEEKLMVAGNQLQNTANPAKESTDSSENQTIENAQVFLASEGEQSNNIDSLNKKSEQNYKISDENQSSIEAESLLLSQNLLATSEDNSKTKESIDTLSSSDLDHVSDNVVNKINTSDFQKIAHVESTAIKKPINDSVNQKTFSKPVIQKPKPIVLDKGVVVLSFGDPAIANPVEKIIKNQLKQKGIKVMNEQFIPGMKQLLNRDIDMAALKQLIMSHGGQAMIIANVNHVGTQQLQYAGRTSTLVNAQLDIDTYDIKTGDSIGSGYGTNINYTSLTATDEASDAVMQYSSELTQNLKSKI